MPFPNLEGKHAGRRCGFRSGRDAERTVVEVEDVRVEAECLKQGSVHGADLLSRDAERKRAGQVPT
jgi:hypothetical protein